MKLDDIPKEFSSQLRTAIVSTLVNKDMVFSELKEETGATDGNLSVQLKNLTEWGMVTAKKVIISNKASTLYSLTDYGLTEFESYVLLLESIFKNTDDE